MVKLWKASRFTSANQLINVTNFSRKEIMNKIEQRNIGIYINSKERNF